jgi:peptide/nickel transport system permease protein
MVADGQRDIVAHPNLVTIPSLMIVLTILAFGLVGDVMRDWLDPRRGMASQL